MALASTLLRATVGGVCAGVGAGVGTVVIGSLTVLLRSGGGDGSRVAAGSDGLSSSRDRLALRAANESISSCGGGSRLCAGHGCMQPAARSGVATTRRGTCLETTFCMHRRRYTAGTSHATGPSAPRLQSNRKNRETIEMTKHKPVFGLETSCRSSLYTL
jgi:hypothetical protein